MKKYILFEEKNTSSVEPERERSTSVMVCLKKWYNSCEAVTVQGAFS